jgi:AcrR family transcriptional regulator
MADVAPSKTASPKREQLVETAWRLFYRDGYHAVGIDTILAEAGVAKMTLYNHFASKDELIVAVLEKRHQDFFNSMLSAVEKAGRSPDKRLLSVFDWLADWIEGAAFNGCAFIRAVAEYPRADEAPHKVAAAHKQSIIDLLTQLAREAELRDAIGIGRQLALLMEGAIITVHTFGPGRVAKDTREAARRLIEAARGNARTNQRQNDSGS